MALRTFPYSGGALLQGYTGTDTQWTARYEMKWKDQSEQAADGEGGAAANGSE
ncbi:hypothetical protein [Paenibacillus sp. PL2-23]|uniref:hypothetical protein n=1 Tax=Paenibacillus sp. PL2-23 TaxID=2100729 RepID=UPI0030F9E17F